MLGWFLRPRIDRREPDAPGEDLLEAERRIMALETALVALQGRLATWESARGDLAEYAQETRAEVNLHSTRFEELIFAVSEGISKVERAEARIRATVKRARKELEAGGTYSPALDAEAQELRVIDGDAVEKERLLVMQPRVEPPDLTGIPGDWEPEDLSILSG